MVLSAGFFDQNCKKPHGEITLLNSITHDYFCPQTQRNCCIFQAALKTHQARLNFRKLEPRLYQSIRLQCTHDKNIGYCGCCSSKQEIDRCLFCQLELY